MFSYIISKCNTFCNTPPHYCHIIDIFLIIISIILIIIVSIYCWEGILNYNQIISYKKKE